MTEYSGVLTVSSLLLLQGSQRRRRTPARHVSRSRRSRFGGPSSTVRSADRSHRLDTPTRSSRRTLIRTMDPRTVITLIRTSAGMYSHCYRRRHESCQFHQTGPPRTPATRSPSNGPWLLDCVPPEGRCPWPTGWRLWPQSTSMSKAGQHMRWRMQNPSGHWGAGLSSWFEQLRSRSREA